MNVYSTSKGVTALVLARLAEAGQLDFRCTRDGLLARVRSAGKADVRVHELLSTRRARAGLDDPVTVAVRARRGCRQAG